MGVLYDIVPYINILLLLFFILGSILLLPLRAWRQKPFYSLTAYRILIALSSFFWFEHYIWIIITKAGWGSDSTILIPGLKNFIIYSPILALAILSGAIIIAKYFPLVSALAPVALFSLTWFVTFRILLWQAPPDFYIADNIPNVWLIISSLITMVFLFIFATGESHLYCVRK